MAFNSLHEFKHSFKQLMVKLVKSIQQALKKIRSQSVLSRDKKLVHYSLVMTTHFNKCCTYQDTNGERAWLSKYNVYYYRAVLRLY